MFLVLISLFVVSAVEGGYYKIRAPPPPPVPPASIHYGPHPPSHHHYPHPAPHPYRIHPPHPPTHHLPTPYIHPYHPQSRIPYIHKGSSREFQRLPPFPQKTVYNPWKHFNTFRAPIVKETFNPPPTTYTPTFIKDDDKGPIHTIPAPNLGPGDKPNLFHNEFHHPPKKQEPEDDLVAVLKHGIHKVNIPHNTGYQVTEDPSLHQPHSDAPSYFAPDPDPSVPAVKVAATTDPHSVPSNGQVPLDIYLQQQADKIEAQQHQAAAAVDSSNALTAQDLFNLLNYQQGSIIPQTQLNQHLLQPNIQFYNPGMLLQQDYQNDNLQQTIQQQFTPQFQTFNYEEQTQQGAYGSNSFPSSSMGLQLNNADLTGSGQLFDDFKTLSDNEVAGSEKDEVFQKVSENEIAPTHLESKRKSIDKKEHSTIKNQLLSSVKQVSLTPYFKQTSINSEQQEHQTTQNPISHTPKQEISIAEEKPASEPSYVEASVQIKNNENIDTSHNLEIVEPEENVQLQKSIQIYENTYADNLSSKDQQTLNDSRDFTLGSLKEGKAGRGLVIAEITPETISNQADLGSLNIPFGARLRPKRF